MKYNATTDANSVVCVFPISGQYATMNRMLFYILLVCGVVALFKKWVWVTLATWTYIMTYSTATVVHFWVMASMRNRGFYNLDMVGAWAIMSTSAMTAAPVAVFSRQLRGSRYRPVFNYWLALIGLNCYIFWFLHNQKYPLEPACVSNTLQGESILLMEPSPLLMPGHFNCTYTCFGRSYPTRDQAEITVMMAKRAFGQPFKLFVGSCTVTLILITMGLIMPSIRRRTRQELEATINSSPSGYTVEDCEAHETAVSEAKHELQTGQTRPLIFWGGPSMSPIALPILISFNEVYIMAKQAFPVSESAWAVGQWAPWVAMSVTLIAAGLNTKYEPQLRELQKEWDEHDQQIKQATAKRKSCSKTTAVSPTPKTQKALTDKTATGSSQTVASGALQPPPKAYVGRQS